MRAYRARKRAAGLRSSRTWVSKVPGSVVVLSDHRRLDIRSLALHWRIMQKVSSEPALLDVAHRNLKRWTARVSGRDPTFLHEWEVILQQPWPVVAEFITNFSDKAVRLRQSSPFAGVLTVKERKQIYDTFRA